MITRFISARVPALRSGNQAIAITGPRQSGKTTLAKQVGHDLPYINFESPLARAEFTADPLGFFARFSNGAILDEVQNIPDLLSYLQVQIDASPAMGRWILTGSQQLELGRGISQSLAGRVAQVELHPLSYAEMKAATVAPVTLAEAVLRGGYPALYDAQRSVDPTQWLEDYLSTFVNRDIRQIIEVKNRTAFDRFVRLCAARTGQLLNASELGRDCGVDNKTATAWLSVLEACYLIRLLHPFARNFGKRLVKSPKLHFIDTGIACRLLHITDVDQLVRHHQWGALVETWCVSEAIKARLNKGLRANAWYWRSSDGLEIDLVFEAGTSLYPMEIKAAVTAQSDSANGIAKFRRLSADEPTLTVEPGAVVYGGDEHRPTGIDRFVPWFAVHQAVP